MEHLTRLRQLVRFPSVRQRIELMFLKRWDAKGRYPQWALRFFPYLHWCSGMDDMLVDDPADCFCDQISEEVKAEARRSWVKTG